MTASVEATAAASLPSMTPLIRYIYDRLPIQNASDMLYDEGGDTSSGEKARLVRCLSMILQCESRSCLTF